MRTAPIALLALAIACRFPNADQRFGLDADGDGIGLDDDCDDNNADVFPGADELCNGDDDNCNGDIDDDPTDAVTFHADVDDDGVGDANGATATACGAPDGFVEATGDCDDNDDDRFPGHAEIADDGVDQDCNGDDTITCFTDADQDGWGVATPKLAPDGSCDTADSESDNQLDCADNDDTRFPGATEIVGDTIDQNCDGFDTPPCFHDDDDDTFGDVTDPIGTNDCAGAGGVTNATDCDDARATVHPGATEACEGRPSDCADWTSPTVPGTPPANEVDDDNDGYVECTFASGVNAGNWGNTETPAIVGGGDCTDLYATVNPNPGTEPCDGFPSDCDVWTTPTNPGTRPATEVDDDNDGFVECTFASGITAGNWGNAETPAVTAGGDCNDAVGTGNNDGGALSFPGASEICDGRINACGGSLPTNEIDNDDDTYVECDFASGVTAGNWANNESPDVAGDLDCDDTFNGTHPGADELCDGEDNDCDTPTSIADEAGKASVEFTSGSWQALSFSSNARTTHPISSNGTVWFCEGTYYTTLTISSLDVEIAGRGNGALTILSGADPSGGGLPSEYPPAARIIDITSSGATRTVEIHDLTLEKGLVTGTGTGAAIRTASSPILTIDDALFRDNSAGNAGAILVSGGTFTVTDTQFEDNVATAENGAGGAIAITAASVASLSVVGFTGNTADFGGAIYTAGTSATTITTGTFTGNDGPVLGGAIYHEAGTINLITSSFGQNDSAFGGAIYVDGGNLYATTTTFTSNTAVDSGGAIYEETPGEVTTTGGSFTSNTADFGGAIFVAEGDLTMNGTTLSSNIAAERGGALRVFGEFAVVTLGSGTTISGNTSNGLIADAGGGGGIAIADGALTMTDADVTGNHAPVGHGGGIFVNDVSGQAVTVTIQGGSVISGNDAVLGNGGGIALYGDADVTMNDSNLIENSAARGGGVYLSHNPASFACADTVAQGTAGVYDNTATTPQVGSGVRVGGGLEINVNGSTMASTSCDWGTSTLDNSPSDIGHNGAAVTGLGAGATFTCIHGGCTFP